MRALAVRCIALLFLASLAHAAPPAPKTVEEEWDVVYLDGARAGVVHTFIRQSADEQKTLHAVTDLQLKLRRFNGTAELRMVQGDDELPGGKVIGVSMHNYMGKLSQLDMQGKVKDEQVHLVITDGNGKVLQQKTNPFPESAVGIYRQQHIYRDHKVKPGDKFAYLSFDPSFTVVFNTRVEVKGFENVTMLSSGKKIRLLKAEAVADDIQGYRPPALTVWVDDKGDVIRQQFRMDGFGLMTLERTPRKLATTALAGAQIRPDIGLRQLIPLVRRLPNGLATPSAVYHITIRDETDVAKAFAHDNHQDVRNVHGNSFDLYVHPIRALEADSDRQPGKKYLDSNFFVNSADARVRRLAQLAVGDETDPGLKAQRISMWVFRHVRSTDDAAFDTADRVAQTLEGDCKQHSMLAAAMCRAAGVPSRVAVGLVYVTRKGLPYLGFHMWVEVWVNGQWRGIDPTMGGPVGAGHLKITAHSWNDTVSLKPLLPLQRVQGKTTIQLIQAGGDE